jgi:hypothetical protein
MLYSRVVVVRSWGRFLKCYSCEVVIRTCVRFPNCTSRVVVFRTWVRLSKCYSPVVVIRTFGSFSKCSSRVVLIGTWVRLSKCYSRVVVVRIWCHLPSYSLYHASQADKFSNSPVTRVDTARRSRDSRLCVGLY